MIPPRSAVITNRKILTAVLYALVPILTLGIEDEFMTDVLGYAPPIDQWILEHSGFTICDLCGLLLWPLVAHELFKPRNRAVAAIFVIFGLSVIASGVYGLLRGTSLERSFFEPSLWKTLVPMGGLTLAVTALFEEREAASRFLSWFCFNQVALAAFSLGMFLLLGEGQPTYFQTTVPIFAGDVLIFIVAAFAITAFRLMARPRIPGALQVTVLGLALMFSLRRSFMAPVISVLLCWVGVAAVRRRGDLRTIWSGARLALVVGAAAWLFVGFVGPLKLTPDLMLGRIASMNPAWAVDQADPIYGTMGHMEDFLDGLDTVRDGPLLGQGLNVWFPLQRTSSWQEANVHAGVFKIWIKLGALGVVGYLLLFGRGLLLARELKSRDSRYPDRLFVVWFSTHFLLLSIFMNSVLLGYKNGFVVAIFAGLTTTLLAERRALKASALPIESVSLEAA